MGDAIKAGMQYELYDQKLILVSDINDLINFFNIFKSYKIDHFFNFNIERIQNIELSDKKYFKVIIQNYD